MSTPVAVASPSLNRVDVVVLGQDNVYHHAAHVDGSGWSDWHTIVVNTTGT